MKNRKECKEIGTKAREAVLNAGATYSPDYFLHAVASPKEEEDYLMGTKITWLTCTNVWRKCC